MQTLAKTRTTPEADLLRRVFDGGRSALRRSMSQFAEQEINVISGPKPGRFRLDSQPFVRSLWAAWGSGKWRRRATTGPVQSGKSLTTFVIPILYHLFEHREDVICGLPTLDMAEVKWEKDIKPIIEASRFRDLLPTKGKGSRGGTPTQVVFRNGASLLFMAGGGGDKQRAGATTRVLAVTETDGMDEIGGTSRETDKIRQLENRTRAHGLNAITYMECTVTTDEGRIWSEYTRGTASRLIVPCPHCLQWVTPEKENLVGWEEADNVIEAGEKARFACPSCGAVMGEHERQSMNAQCRLLHRGQEVTEDGRIVGEPVRTDTIGFRWNAWNNLFMPLEQLGQSAWQAAETGSEEADREQKQFIWCVPLEVSGGKTVDLTAGIIRGSARGYSGRVSGIPKGTVPPGAQCVTGFVDLGKRALNWLVDGWTNCRNVVDYGAFETSQPDVVGEEDAIRDALHDLLRTINASYPGIFGLVDSGNWNTVVYDVLRHFPNWMPSKGFGRGREQKQGMYHHPKPSIDKRPSPDAQPWHRSQQKSPRVWVVNFDADHFKRLTVNAIALPPVTDDGSPSGNAVRLFGDSPGLHDELARQLLNETWDSGKREWKRRSSHADNHYFDCLVGSLVARMVSAAMPRPSPIGPAPRSTFKRPPVPRLTPGD